MTMRSEQINELATALAKAQGEIQSAKKDSKGHGYNFADLATVIEELRAVLPKNGLSFSQLVGFQLEDKVSVTTLILHSSGQFMGQESSIKIPDMRSVNDTQRAGAALSYLRRYSLQAAFGMASEDNDAAEKVNDSAKSFSQQKKEQVSSAPIKVSASEAAFVSAGVKTEAQVQAKTIVNQVLAPVSSVLTVSSPVENKPKTVGFRKPTTKVDL